MTDKVEFTQPNLLSANAAAAAAAAERPSLWTRLTEPHPSIEEVGARHLARVLSTFLLVSSVMLCGGITVMYATAPGSLPGVIAIGVVVVIAYRISRTPRFRLAAAMTAVACVIGPSASVLVGRPPLELAVGQVVWSNVAVIVGSPYLPVRIMVVVVLSWIAALVGVYVALPVMTVSVLVNAVWFAVAVSTMVLIMSYHRTAIERQRLAVIEERSAELAKLNRGMETMIYVISHDLKEPLRAIANFSGMVDRRYAGRLDDKGRDFLRRVVRGAERMRVLLDDILQLSRAQRIEQPGAPVPGAEIVASALGRLEPVIAEKRAVIRVADELPAFRVDVSWASGAVYNLVDNALKYTAEGARPEVDIAAYRGPGGVGLVVRDRGPGVEPEHRERIFELFQRAVSRDVPGTGAGLAIVRQIAERHGGAAWVEPRAGGGSAFYITFQGPVVGAGKR